MASRTQIVCLHEGSKGNTDAVFINRLLRSLNPTWIRPPSGSNIVRLVPCGSRSAVIDALPDQLRACLQAGSDTTLMVWADLDHDMADGEALKKAFRTTARKSGISDEEFDTLVFAFAKDRIENWIEFLKTGSTDERREGPRVNNSRTVADAARVLAKRCEQGDANPRLPPSLLWSCDNWKTLATRLHGS